METIAPFSTQFIINLKDNKNIIIPQYILKNNCEYDFKENMILENIDSVQMNNFLNFLVEQEIFLKRNISNKFKICKDIAHVAEILKYNNNKIKIIVNFFRRKFEIEDNTFIEKWMVDIADKFVKEKYIIKKNYLKIKKFMELSEIDLYNSIEKWNDLENFFENKKTSNLEKYQRKIFIRIKFLKSTRLKCEVCDSILSLSNRKKCVNCKSKLNLENIVKI